MGNVLLENPQKEDPSQQYHRWLQQNSDLVGKEILQENKLFRTTSCKFKHMSIILKAFFKRDQSPLTEYFQIFDRFSNQKYMNIAPLKLFNQKDNKSFVVAYRQKMAQTMEDIIIANPLPTQEKKMWLIFQMIKTVSTLHKDFNYYHGHIRTSNFIVTSYGYLMLTDFAFYKPPYMLSGNEEGWSEFRVFYGSSVTNCTLAPEKVLKEVDFKSKQRSIPRIVPHGVGQSCMKSSPQLSLQFTNQFTMQSISTSFQLEMSMAPINLTMSPINQQIDEQSELNQKSMENMKILYSDQISCLQKMDIFSLGCSILEVLRDGRPLMNEETYLKFREGLFSIDSFIEEACRNLELGPQIRQMLKAMLSLDPNDRPRIEQIQQDYNGLINLGLYSLIWCCSSAFATISFSLPDQRIALIQSIFRFIQVNERGLPWNLKIKLPKLFSSFSALEIFKSLIHSKVIQADNIPNNSVLSRIIGCPESDSEEEDKINNKTSLNKQILISLTNSQSLKMSSPSYFMGEKVLCPPEWNNEIIKLVQPKCKETELCSYQILKNRLQTLLQQYKTSQNVRKMKIAQSSSYYKQYSILVTLLFSCIRGCKYNTSKLIAIQLIKTIAKQSTDQTRLTLIIPMFISLLDDSDVVILKHVFSAIIDLFYMFIDPFQNEEETTYYGKIIKMLVSCVQNQMIRIHFFSRFGQIYSICQWLQVHIKKICKKSEVESKMRKLVTEIKKNFHSYTVHEIKELVANMPTVMWPDMFEHIITFIRTQKTLALLSVMSITHAKLDYSQMRILDAIDQCIEEELYGNNISLYYSIKYFTNRKLCTPNIINKICPLVVHPHLWVREQAKDYLRMVLEENSPSRVYYLLYDIFEAPLPLQPKNLIDDYLLPAPLRVEEADFSNREMKAPHKKGTTYNLFQQYLHKSSASRSFPVSNESEVAKWICLSSNVMDSKIDPTSLNTYIKESICQLFEANFLYCVGKFETRAMQGMKEQEKTKIYSQLNSTFSLLSNQLASEKKDFFYSLSAIIHSNFEKLLTRSARNTSINKIRISKCIYLIMEILYRFWQFKMEQIFKIDDYYCKIREAVTTTMDNFRPKGNLISQIYEHNEGITCLENVADKFLVSASLDGTIRVFNVPKIYVNITCQSQGSYSMNEQQKVKINSLATFDNTFTIAAATNKGIITLLSVERMSGQNENNPKAQLLKYVVGKEVKKIVTFKNQNSNQCLAYITGAGVVGVQDIRMKSKAISCTFGTERGLAKALTFSHVGPSLLIGTLDGYVLTYDIRCNLVSNIKQLRYFGNSAPITGIYPTNSQLNGRNLFALTYPSQFYEFSYFDIHNYDQIELLAERHYTSCDVDKVADQPTLINRTKEEIPKINDGFPTQQIMQKQLSYFSRNFKILESLTDPLKMKKSKIREVWVEKCKQRNRQITSLYKKKSLPFLEHLQNGILTNMNPCACSPAQKKLKGNLSVLVDQKELFLKQSDWRYEIQKKVIPNGQPPKLFTFQDESNADYLTCCKIISSMIFVGGEDSIIKLYK